MNPYQAPQTTTIEDPTRLPQERLVRIAKLQREISVLVLVQFAVYLSAGILRSFWNFTDGSPRNLSSAILAIAYLVLAIVTGLAVVVVGIVSIITAAQMAYTMHGTAVAIICSFLLFVPCVGFLTLLGLHASATTPLRSAGFRVGLLGADMNAVTRDDRAQQRPYGAPPHSKLGPKGSRVLGIALLLSGLAAGCIFGYKFYLRSIEQQVLYKYGGVAGQESISSMIIWGSMAVLFLFLGLGILLLVRRRKREDHVNR